jgi:hypothetical protein
MTTADSHTEHEPGTCCLGAESFYLPVPSTDQPLPWRWSRERGAVVDSSDALVLPVFLWGRDDSAKLAAVLARINAEAA